MNSIIFPILIAFAFSVLIYPAFIPYLRRFKVGQTVRLDGPQTHLSKTGTPTMGGLAIVAALIITSLMFIFFNRNSADNAPALITLIITALFALIGFADDYIKVVLHRSLGLRAWQKFSAQIIVTALFCVSLVYFKADLRFVIPFTDIYADLGVFTIPVIIFAMLGCVNGVNLTDGLDGLAGGVTSLVCVFFLIVAAASGSALVPAIGAACGALLGFLLFNAHPAKVFMGDTGALALGGFVMCVAIFLNMGFVLVIVGFIYVAEILSDILQVIYFRLSGGKRLFRMAPLHHHFEKLGWAETRVVSVFYISTAVLCLIGFLATNALFI